MVTAIAANPYAKRNNQKPLKGVPNGYRLREGDWRISFTLDHKSGILDVFEIASRGSAYRR